MCVFSRFGFEAGPEAAMSVAEPKITLRILRRCNYRCPLCSTFSDPEKRGLLSLADARKCLDILGAERFRGQLNISGGEPVLHGELEAILAYGADTVEASTIDVFTNGDWVGADGWEHRLRRLLAIPGIRVRFSLDRQHAEGAVLARSRHATADAVNRMERIRLEKARLFVEKCQNLSAKPGVQYDFAFKGTLEEARRYTSVLGEVPLYLIRLQERPAERKKELGFLAIDIDESNSPWVYLTLGHLASGEPLGGLESLAEALSIHRSALGGKGNDGAR